MARRYRMNEMIEENQTDITRNALLGALCNISMISSNICN